MRGAQLIRALALAAIVILPGVEAAFGTPRYSIESGETCELCHTNPAGGGQRTLYASQFFLPTRLAMLTLAEEEIDKINPQIGENVTVGADLRTVYLQRDDRDSRENFVQMQGSFYVSVEMSRRFSVYFHQEFGTSQTNVQAYELFGLAYVLPASGYAKVGKFVPAFGWKLPDHRHFSRREFVFLPAFPPHSDTGVEVGVAPGPFTVQASVTNGDYSGNFDSDGNLAFTSRAEYRARLGALNIALGASFFTNDRTAQARNAGGPFAGASWGRFTWLGEFDWTRLDPGNEPDKITSLTTSQQLAISILKGLALIGTYDFHDPDTELETGAIQRIGVAVDAMIVPFFAFRPALNFFRIDEGDDIGPLEDAIEFQAQVHFLY